MLKISIPTLAILIGTLTIIGWRYDWTLEGALTFAPLITASVAVVP
jgi:hypothetical protein